MSSLAKTTKLVSRLTSLERILLLAEQHIAGHANLNLSQYQCIADFIELHCSLKLKTFDSATDEELHAFQGLNGSAKAEDRSLKAA